MAPDLKKIVVKNIMHTETNSVIKHAMQMVNKTEGGEIQDPDVRGMVEGMLEANSWRRIDETKKRKHDKEPMTDEEVEGYSVEIRDVNGGALGQFLSEREKEEQRRAKERFEGYVHHHYVKRWGLLKEGEGKDEEWFIREPVVLREGDEGYLCEMCRGIDFGVLLSQPGLPGNNTPGQTRIQLHGLERILTREHCAFCRLISRKVREDKVLDIEDEAALKAVNISLNVLNEGPENALRLEIELDDAQRVPEMQRIIIQKVKEEDSKPYEGCLVEQDNISAGIYRKWLALCENEHPTIDLIVENKSPRLRLIDVNEERIVEIEGLSRYTALSYVWGGANQPQYTSQTKEVFQQVGGLASESLDLPCTIKDAMVVTKQLGIRYLWVDALCIQQDDQQDKAATIANMGTIYSNAVVTIVASTNSNPSTGLPGVSTTSRRRAQICQNIQGMQLAVAFHDHRKRVYEVEDSVWNSRAWTYQERQLSQRMLFFTDSQACFICPHSTFFEDTHPVTYPHFKPAPIMDRSQFYNFPPDLQYRIWTDPTQYHFPNKAFETEGDLTIFVSENQEEIYYPVYQCRQISDSDTSSMTRIQEQNIWNTYRQAVNAFTSRNITFDADTVNAFDGMSELIRRGANTKSYFGIPSFAFEQALLWYPKECLRRRKDQDGNELFPSWSWAGWKGSCHYKGRGWYNGLYRCPISAVQWMQRPDSGWLTENWDRLVGPDDHALRQSKQAIFDGNYKFLLEIDSRQRHKFDFEELGWKSSYDEKRNQHGYTHELYPGIIFNYPIDLPHEKIVDLPDTKGALHFKTYSSRVEFCDMSVTEYIQQYEAQPFLQIGLGDEKRSANYRSPRQRIIYHQGYRAGFLVLNVCFEEVDLDKAEDLRMVAMSRDEVPHTALPPSELSNYKMLQPVYITYACGSREQWDPEKLHASISKPNESVTPVTRPKSENGDAKWDEFRYEDVLFPLYNVLLLRKRGENVWERIGVGKMHYHAFHHARPKMDLFELK